MKLKEAIEILERHNQWRRDRSESQTLKMENPTRLGIAIDTVVNNYNTKTKLKEAIIKAKPNMDKIKDVDNFPYGME